MEMRFFWVVDSVKAGKIDIQYYPGKDLGVYNSKHHLGTHHTAVPPWYLHEKTSLQELIRASKPSTLKGCVGILPDGSQQTNLLPQIPSKQSVPISREVLPGYFGLPIRIPMLRSLIGPAIGKA
jgi:hypothetical protein